MDHSLRSAGGRRAQRPAPRTDRPLRPGEGRSRVALVGLPGAGEEREVGTGTGPRAVARVEE